MSQPELLAVSPEADAVFGELDFSGDKANMGVRVFVQGFG